MGNVRNPRRARFWSLALLSALFLASLSPTQLRAQDATTIRIGTAGADANAEAYYAQELGLFQKAGINAQIQTIPRGAGATITAAILGGSLDIGEGDLIALAAAHEHGLPITILAPAALYSSAAPTTALVVAKASPIQSATDLNGKTIAVVSLAGPAYISTVAWIKANGGNPSSMKFIELPVIQMAAAIDRGSVDAGTITEPTLSASLDRTRVFADVYDAIGKTFLINAWFSTNSWVQKNPQAAKEFISVIAKTAIWGNNPANHSMSAAILAKYDHLPVARIQRAQRATYAETFDAVVAQRLIDAAVTYKSLKTSFPIEQLLSPLALRP